MKNTFRAVIENVIIFKFGTNDTNTADKKTSLDIKPQVAELNIFESIFHPIMKAELVIADTIGLFNNWPLTGEEIVKVIYKSERDTSSKVHYYVIESIDDIIPSDDARSVVFSIHLVSIEAFSNTLKKIMHCYHGQSHEAVKAIYDEYITKPIKKFLPAFTASPITTEPSDAEVAKNIIIPNLNPLSAINMISEYTTPKDDKYTYLFFQTQSGFFYKPMQSMFSETKTGAARRKAFKNSYKYISDEIPDSEKMQNDGRLITNIAFNKRHSTLQKISMGYFQNNLFEINIAQKAYFTTKTTPDKIVTIEKNKLNTKKYSESVPIDTDKEEANRVKYILQTQKENDISQPISDLRDRWGRDLIAKIAMSQVDIIVTIPGDTTLHAGDLFYAEIPENHGFNTISEDDLISGYFLITDITHTINQAGNYSTSARINKDSYKTSVDRNSRFT